MVSSHVMGVHWRARVGLIVSGDFYKCLLNGQRWPQVPSTHKQTLVIGSITFWLYMPQAFLFFPARFRLSSERCCCSKLKGLKVQCCALAQHVQGGLGREEMGVLHREPVRGLAPRTKTLFMGRPTTQRGGAAQRGWQATRAPCRTKYWHSERAETNPAVYWTLHIPSVNANFVH